MESIIYILKIILYFVFVYLMYLSALTSKIKHVKKDEKTKNRKILLIIIVFFCLFMGIYSIICGKFPYASDRLNYAFRFENDFYLPYVKNESLGLYYLEIILHLFTHDPKYLFFIVAFLYLFMTLLAYNDYNEIEPFALLLLGLSAYLSFGYYMIKQCIAIGLIALSFSSYSKGRIKRSILFIALAIMFHESAWIIIPVYIAMSFSNNKYLRIIEYLLLIFCVVFFNQINTIIIHFVTLVIPGMDYQLSYYLSNTGTIIESMNYFTALKGLPFYFILFYGYIKRFDLQTKIKDYNKYMFLTFFVSIATLLSTFMYWMFRFAIYCYFPIFVFSSLILKNLQTQREKDFFGLALIIIFGFLTIRMWYQYYFWYGGL